MKFKTIPDLEILVDFVVSKYKPEKIILFGSYATKTERKNSDIDLLIIKETSKAFGVVRRKRSKSMRYKIEAENLFSINTSDIKRSSLGIGALRRDSSVFYDDYSLSNDNEEDGKLLKELLDDETLPRYALQKIENAFNFKTPLNIAFASYKPERDFIKRLVREETAKKIDAWIKSPDIGFYSVEYSWQKGTHPKQGSFNPDFFIKIGNDNRRQTMKAILVLGDEKRQFCKNLMNQTQN